MSSLSETNFNLLTRIPNDQYACSDCGCVPEIINLYFEFGIIEINCPIHGEKYLQLDTYFKEEINHIYYSFNCHRSGIKQSDYLDINEKDYFIFNYYPNVDEKPIYCEDCCKEYQLNNKNYIKVNEMNCKCETHFKEYIKYCLKCKRHFCDDKNCKCEHQKEENIVLEIKKAEIEDINIIKEKKNEIEKNKKYELTSKLLSTIIETYEKHPSNYFTTLNIKNVAGIINDINNNKRNKDEIFQIQKEKYEILLKEGLKKLEVLEKRLKEIVNVKLGISLDGDEIKIDINNKNVLNLDLNNLNLVKFDELEEINLSRNKISDMEPLKNFKSTNLKKIDLSYNKICSISP